MENTSLDVCEPSVIISVLFVIMSQTILIRYSGKFFLIISQMSPGIQTMSKAFSRSIRQAATP